MERDVVLTIVKDYLKNDEKTFNHRLETMTTQEILDAKRFFEDLASRVFEEGARRVLG